MKLSVMSDLHVEFMDFEPPPVAADVIVLAGDIFTEHHGLVWARTHFADKPIVYVMGNHEFYNTRYEDVLQSARRQAAALEIHLLENDEVVIDGVRFLGTTLWTDFEIEEPDIPRSLAYRHANLAMNDFNLVLYRSRLLSAQDAHDLHRRARTWLSERLATPFSGKTVVVTHHLPHRSSIDAQFLGNPLNPAYASHMPELVCSPVDLWIHGHTHCSCDYEVGGTRVLCNPRGYAPSGLNQGFDVRLVVEV